jgi:hypothetical protein
MRYEPTSYTDEDYIEKDLAALEKDINDGSAAPFDNLDV